MAEPNLPCWRLGYRNTSFNPNYTHGLSDVASPSLETVLGLTSSRLSSPNSDVIGRRLLLGNNDIHLFRVLTVLCQEPGKINTFLPSST